MNPVRPALPTLSVTTPSFRQGRFIERTIRSVLDQGIDGLEYVVVDGGSDDGTVEILERYGDRLRFTSEPDRGQTDAVNKGIARTSGEVIGWLNSDDVYYPGALAAVLEAFAADPELDVLYGDADHIDEADRVLEPYYTEPWNAKRLETVCFLCQPAVFFRRRVVDECGPLDESLRFGMDYEYWLRLAHAGRRFRYLERRLAGSRLYAENKTLGQRVAVHAELNDMLRARLGSVPDRWLTNYAHAVVEERGRDRSADPVGFALRVARLARWSARRWNGGISADLLATTEGWVRDARARERAAAPADTEADRPVEDPRPARRADGALEIAFDVSQTGTGKAGCGFEADALICALAEVDERNRYRLLPVFGGDYWDPAGPDATRKIERPGFERGFVVGSSDEARRAWEAPGEELEARLGWPDIVHAHNFFCPETIRRARVVYTLHDLAFLDHPEWTTEANRLTCFDGVFNASCHADFVVADSEATRRHFLASFPHYPEERTTVVHLASRLAADSLGSRPPSADGLESGEFFLNVGTIEPRKNQLRLIQAYSEFVGNRPAAPPLVIAGGPGWLMDEFDHRVCELGLEARVRRLGYVEDEALIWLYRNCRAFLYPSLFEGFGLPVVEAMSFGAPVLTSDTSSLPEIAGDAALIVDPREVASIAAAIRDLDAGTELRADLGERGRARAAVFSWAKAARQTLEVYARVVAMERWGVA